ncbi:MAG: MATE family efflux transporter [Lachnospiraceae bacterium]|nr:MATE family efflux transporter [Lachnospiraceae bacterium]
MTANEKNSLFETAKVTTIIRKFALPAIMSSLVGSVYNIVDQIFIGQKIGTLGNAATNVAFPLVMLMVTFSMTFGVGASSNFSMDIGSGNRERAAKAVGNALWYMIVSGIVLMIGTLAFLQPLMLLFGARGQTLDYAVAYTGITAIGIPFYIVGTATAMLIRADGSPQYAMCATIAGAVLNTILDPVFLFVFDMGMEGAALATIIGQIVSAGISVCYLKKFQHIRLDRSSFQLSWQILKSIVALGLPSGSMQITVMLIQIVMNNTLGYYGDRSVYGRDIPLACVGIISKISTVFNSLISGISQSCQPMIGYNYGAGNHRRVKETFWTAAKVVTAISAGAFLLFQVFPRQIISIFGNGSELYYEFGTRYLRIFLFCTFVSGIQILCANFFPAIGKAKLGMVCSLSRQVFFQLPLLLCFPLFWGMDGVLFAGPIADAMAAILSLSLVRFQLNSQDS